MKRIWEYGWMVIIPAKVALQEFDFILYFLIVLSILFILSKLFLKYEIRFLYPEFFKDTDHSSEIKH
tara:strand:- start:3181 stop:3381 length:201 start_codon:yes stop_codon:yes gene_type:complete